MPKKQKRRPLTVLQRKGVKMMKQLDSLRYTCEPHEYAELSEAQNRLANAVGLREPKRRKSSAKQREAAEKARAAKKKKAKEKKKAEAKKKPAAKKTAGPK